MHEYEQTSIQATTAKVPRSNEMRVLRETRTYTTGMQTIEDSPRAITSHETRPAETEIRLVLRTPKRRTDRSK